MTLSDRQIVINLLEYLEGSKKNVKYLVENDPEYTGLRCQWGIWICEGFLGIPCSERTDTGPLPPSRQRK